jgi:preprotein translocase subunit SecG
LKIVLVLVAVALTVLVVLQDNRGGGLAGVLAGYGGESAFGTETVSKVKKLTAYLGVLFFVVLLTLAIVGQRSRVIIQPESEKVSEEVPPSTAAETPSPAPSAPSEPTATETP